MWAFWHLRQRMSRAGRRCAISALFIMNRMHFISSRPGERNSAGNCLPTDGYRFWEMIRLSAKAVPVPQEEQQHWIDVIFEEQPYLSNVYPKKTREIGIIFEIRDAQIEYFNLGVHPIFRETYIVGDGKEMPKGYQITDACIAAPVDAAARRAVSFPGSRLRSTRNIACTAETVMSTVRWARFKERALRGSRRDGNVWRRGEMYDYV